MKNLLHSINFFLAAVLAFSLWVPDVQADPQPVRHSGEFSFMVEVDYEALAHPMDFTERQLAKVTLEGGAVDVILNYNSLRSGTLGILPLPEGDWRSTEAKNGCANSLPVEQGSFNNETGIVKITRSQVWKWKDSSGNIRLKFLFQVKFSYSHVGGVGRVVLKPESLGICPGDAPPVVISPPDVAGGEHDDIPTAPQTPEEESGSTASEERTAGDSSITTAGGTIERGTTTSSRIGAINGATAPGNASILSDKEVISDENGDAAVGRSGCSMSGVSGAIDFGTILGIPFALLPFFLRRKGR